MKHNLNKRAEIAKHSPVVQKSEERIISPGNNVPFEETSLTSRISEVVNWPRSYSKRKVPTKSN